MKLDLEKIKKLEEKLEQAGIRVRYRSRGELRLQKCPLHKDKTPSLTINTHENRFHCLSCGFRGTMTKLLREYGIDYHSSGYYVPTIDELETFLNEVENQEKSGEKNRARFEDGDDEKPIYISNPLELKNYRYYHPYLESRGLSKEFILANKIGFDPFGLRVTIPMFLFGDYFGCARRTVVGDIPKIKYDQGLPKESIVYQPLTCDGSSEHLLVAEGPIDALKASFFGQDSVSILGCQVSIHQLEIIYEIAKGRDIIIALDNDGPGRAGIDRFLSMSEAIDNLMVYQYNLKNHPEIKDIGEMNEEQFKWGMENAISILEY